MRFLRLVLITLLASLAAAAFSLIPSQPTDNSFGTFIITVVHYGWPMRSVTHQSWIGGSCFNGSICPPAWTIEYASLILDIIVWLAIGIIVAMIIDKVLALRRGGRLAK